jgi:hypothetical protein
VGFIVIFNLIMLKLYLFFLYFYSFNYLLKCVLYLWFGLVIIVELVNFAVKLFYLC